VFEKCFRSDQAPYFERLETILLTYKITLAKSLGSSALARWASISLRLIVGFGQDVAGLGRFRRDSACAGSAQFDYLGTRVDGSRAGTAHLVINWRLQQAQSEGELPAEIQPADFAPIPVFGHGRSWRSSRRRGSDEQLFSLLLCHLRVNASHSAEMGHQQDSK
jgi:hypothetical protein